MRPPEPTAPENETVAEHETTKPLFPKISKRIRFVSLVLGTIVVAGTVSGAGVRGVVYLADNRYITQEAWIQRDKEREINELKKEIHVLETKAELEEITPLEKALLKDYIREYEELTK